MKDLGTLVPVVTPCTRAGRIDTEGLCAVIDDMLRAGCSSIFVLGSTGRGPWWPRAKRELVCRTAADHLGADVPLFAGCMASGLDDIILNAEAMADAGARFAVVTAPGYFHYSQEHVQSIFAKVADASPIPVLVYDIPAFTGMKLDNAPLVQLARHENVAGFKDSSNDMTRFRALCEAFADLDDFILLQGKEALLAESLAAGASGFVVSLIHIAPKPFVDLYRAVRGNDLDAAEAIQERITRLFELTEATIAPGGATATFFHLMNAALAKRGVCENVLLEHEGDAPPEIHAVVDEMTALFD